MAKKYLTSIDLNKNEIQNAVIQPLAAAPSSPKLGQIYMSTTDSLLYIFNGTAWVAVGAIVSVAGKTGIVTLVKGDVGLGNVDNTSDADKKTAFTGSIADGNSGFVTGDAAFDALALKLSLAGGTMTGALAMGSNKITGLGAPTADADAATKKYADDLVAGLGPVFRFKGTKATTSELPLSGNKQGDVWLVSADNSEYVWTLSEANGAISGWEKLGVTVDLSGYLQLAGGTMTGALAMGGNKVTGLGAPTSDADAATKKYVDDAVGGSSGVNTASGTIGTSATSVTVNYTGTVISAYAIMNGSQVIVDIAIGVSSVTFTVAEAPSSAVTCVVAYV